MDTSTGKVLFETKMHEGVPKVKRHTKSTHANSTLATDGTHIVAMLGSEGLFAFDMKGKQIWKVDLGVLDSGFFMVPAAQWEFWQLADHSRGQDHHPGRRAEGVVPWRV